MTCKDCISFEACSFRNSLPIFYGESDSDDIYDTMETACKAFKDKSKFIELPCSVGDYCIWHDDLWYVNNITYCCDGSFILWMSMADKSSCGAEAIASEVEFISKEEAEKKLEAIKND